MYEAIQKILDKEEQIDYVLSGEFARRIELWSNMYKDKAPWLSPTVQSLCLPASVAGEVARLTTLELQSHISGSSRATYLDKFYQRVCEQLRIPYCCTQCRDQACALLSDIEKTPLCH